MTQRQDEGRTAYLPEQGRVADRMPQRQTEALHDAQDPVALLQRDQLTSVRDLHSIQPDQGLLTASALFQAEAGHASKGAQNPVRTHLPTPGNKLTTSPDSNADTKGVFASPPSTQA